MTLLIPPIHQIPLSSPPNSSLLHYCNNKVHSPGSSPIDFLHSGLPDHQQLPDDPKQPVVEPNHSGCQPEAADDPADQRILNDDDHAHHMETHVQHEENHQEEDVLRLQLFVQFSAGRTSTGGLHSQMAQLALADLANQRLLHAATLGRRRSAETMREVLAQTGPVHELDGPAAVAGRDEGVVVGALQTDAALLGLPTDQQRPISHINKFQPAPPINRTRDNRPSISSPHPPCLPFSASFYPPPPPLNNFLTRPHKQKRMIVFPMDRSENSIFFASRRILQTATTVHRGLAMAGGMLDQRMLSWGVVGDRKSEAKRLEKRQADGEEMGGCGERSKYG